MSFINWLVFEQNSRLNNSILDSRTNTLRQGAWGLIEMDVSAAYLRKLSSEQVDADEFDLSFTPTGDLEKAIGVPRILHAESKYGSLAYRFHMMKPKEVIIVDETGLFFISVEHIRRKLLQSGILVLHTNKTLDSSYYFDHEQVYPHPFMLIFAGDDFDENEYLFVTTR
jgi:hypothetical protein